MGTAAIEAAHPIRCPRCNAPLPPEAIEAKEMALCPDRGAGVLVHVFPVILAKPAAVSSARRSRFLCRLCQVDPGGEALCPGRIISGAPTSGGWA